MGETHRAVSPARVFARPTADEIWLGAAQKAALSQLSRPAHIRVIVGPSSSGKTTLLQYLGAHLHSGAVVLQCRGPKQDASAVLVSLLLSADLAPWDLSEIEQRTGFGFSREDSLPQTETPNEETLAAIREIDRDNLRYQLVGSGSLRTAE